MTAVGKKPPNAGKGRKKGVPNKATADVRQAIARVLEGNAENLGRWLTSVAEGEQEPRTAEQTKVVWRRKPDPARALELAMSLCEYQLPKLARTEISGDLAVRATLIIED